MQSAKTEMANKKIFISHSYKNEKFATWLSELLEYLGADRDAIFYSSNFRQGVHKKISEDVFGALKNTLIDIIILSNEYKSSEYCLNEAGAIRFKDNLSEKIVISLPEIIGNYEAGFIDEDYFQYRLLDPTFLDSLTIRLKQDLYQHGLLRPNIDKGISSFSKISNELEEYKASLPIFENLLIPYVDEYGFKRELEGIILAKRSIQDMYCRNPNLLHAQIQLFYKDYNREITIYAADRPGEIKVQTSTVYTIINLSNDDYTEALSSHFLKKNGGYDSYKKIDF